MARAPDAESDADATPEVGGDADRGRGADGGRGAERESGRDADQAGRDADADARRDAAADLDLAGGTGRGPAVVTVDDLQVAFLTDRETIRAVDGASFDVARGETVGIVGESGSGKTVTARSLMGLIESPGRVLPGSSVRFQHRETVQAFADEFPGRTVDLAALEAGNDPAELFEHRRVDATPADFGYASADEASVWDFVQAGYGERLGLVDREDCVFVTAGDGDRVDEGFVEITRASGEALRRLRGGRIAMVFQDPLTSLNPVYTVGNQIKEALELHRGLTGGDATDVAISLLEDVGIPDARRRLTEYPHQFSGGMRQRAVIAMALACDPELLICDEPTTALDVTIQAQILELLQDLQRERDLSILFITHDMGVIAEITDRVNVMYAGEIVETAPVEPLFAEPKHPYTEGLLESIPGRAEGERLRTIEGQVPTPHEPATHCRFAPRCPYAWDDCREVHPSNLPVAEGADDHTAACLLYPEDVEQEEAVRRHREVDEPAAAATGDVATASRRGGGEARAEAAGARDGGPGAGPGAAEDGRGPADRARSRLRDVLEGVRRRVGGESP